MGPDQRCFFPSFPASATKFAGWHWKDNSNNSNNSRSSSSLYSRLSARFQMLHLSGRQFTFHTFHDPKKLLFCGVLGGSKRQLISWWLSVNHVQSWTFLSIMLEVWPSSWDISISQIQRFSCGRSSGMTRNSQTDLCCHFGFRFFHKSLDLTKFWIRINTDEILSSSDPSPCSDQHFRKCMLTPMSLPSSLPRKWKFGNLRDSFICTHIPDERQKGLHIAH